MSVYGSLSNLRSHSLRPIRSSRRAVKGHQNLETRAAQITPMMTLVDRWNAMENAEISCSRELYLRITKVTSTSILRLTRIDMSGSRRQDDRMREEKRT